MQSIPIFEAKNKLPLYIHMVEQGESFEITRHGKPVAYLVSKDEKKDIIDLILKNEKVIDVRDFYAMPTGYKYIVILTIDIDGQLKTFTSHKIADTLEKSITKKFRKIHKVIIHVNPVNVSKKK